MKKVSDFYRYNIQQKAEAKMRIIETQMLSTQFVKMKGYNSALKLDKRMELSPESNHSANAQNLSKTVLNILFYAINPYSAGLYLRMSPFKNCLK